MTDADIEQAAGCRSPDRTAKRIPPQGKCEFVGAGLENALSEIVDDESARAGWLAITDADIERENKA